MYLQYLFHPAYDDGVLLGRHASPRFAPEFQLDSLQCLAHRRVADRIHRFGDARVDPARTISTLIAQQQSLRPLNLPVRRL